jgi:hypothetical protein
MSYTVLKEEINQTHNTIYDIAKWKLILVSSISAVALGLSKDQTGDFHLLFLLLPLVCAYSDLLYYQNLLHIFVLATFLRKRQPGDSVVEYEQFVRETRRKKVFNLELSSQLLSSLVFSFRRDCRHLPGNSASYFACRLIMAAANYQRGMGCRSGVNLVGVCPIQTT